MAMLRAYTLTMQWTVNELVAQHAIGPLYANERRIVQAPAHLTCISLPEPPKVGSLGYLALSWHNPSAAAAAQSRPYPAWVRLQYDDEHLDTRTRDWLPMRHPEQRLTISVGDITVLTCVQCVDPDTDNPTLVDTRFHFRSPGASRGRDIQSLGLTYWSRQGGSGPVALVCWARRIAAAPVVELCLVGVDLTQWRQQ
jgi:hypothetical protein